MWLSGTPGFGPHSDNPVYQALAALQVAMLIISRESCRRWECRTGPRRTLNRSACRFCA